MTQLKGPIRPTWELDTIFPGGSSSDTYREFLETLECEIAGFGTSLKTLKAPANLEETESLDELIQGLQTAGAQLSEADSFVGCLTAQNVYDKKAVQLDAKVTALRAAFENVTTLFQNVLRNTDEVVWSAWMKREEISPISFVLSEKRENAREKLAPELESLASDLAVDGYHGWGQHYDTIVSKVAVPFEDEHGKTVMLSVGQAANKLDNPNRSVREQVFGKWEEAWKDAADYCADTLNRLAGYRLGLYAKRGWNDLLKEPLAMNRMSKETLDAMWKIVEEGKPIFVKYLERKAKLLGLERLNWTDVDSPLGELSGEITYEQAAKDIVKLFHGFSPKLSDFVAQAFEKRWIEAENRPGKRPGGFCTSLPVSKQTRIFMTFGGTVSNVSTLAHELGHGYHQYLMDDLPAFNQKYAMNVAETASTFAEMIVSDALVKQAPTKAEKILLLADKIQRAISFNFNIHARFLFETRFYAKRKQGMLDAGELSALMEEAQREAYQGMLGTYHPHFWASKLHFYMTDVPFYNFPYTFGYMFSTGIYALAQREGQGFADKYDALLRDTGQMTVEELAAKHLGADLTKPDFWREALSLSVADVNLFLELTE